MRTTYWTFLWISLFALCEVSAKDNFCTGMARAVSIEFNSTKPDAPLNGDERIPLGKAITMAERLWLYLNQEKGKELGESPLYVVAKDVNGPLGDLTPRANLYGGRKDVKLNKSGHLATLAIIQPVENPNQFLTLTKEDLAGSWVGNADHFGPMALIAMAKTNDGNIVKNIRIVMVEPPLPSGKADVVQKEIEIRQKNREDFISSAGLSSQKVEWVIASTKADLLLKLNPNENPQTETNSSAVRLYSESIRALKEAGMGEAEFNDFQRHFGRVQLGAKQMDDIIKVQKLKVVNRNP